MKFLSLSDRAWLVASALLIVAWFTSMHAAGLF